MSPGSCACGDICYTDPMVDLKREDFPGMSDGEYELFKLIASEEPLHPDLQPYFAEMEEIGGALRHPLVYQIMGVRPGLANMQYQKKKEAIARAIEKGDWYTYIFLHERPWRTDALLAVRNDLATDIPGQQFWQLAGSVWVDSENIWQSIDLWEDLLATDLPGQHWMMDKDERKAFRKLPDQLIVYRGSVPGLNESGLSWTLNHSVALFFAKRFNNAHNQGGVIDWGTVAKADAIAFFNGRGEEEIVVRAHEAVTITRRQTVATAK